MICIKIIHHLSFDILLKSNSKFEIIIYFKYCFIQIIFQIKLEWQILISIQIAIEYVYGYVWTKLMLISIDFNLENQFLIVIMI